MDAFQRELNALMVETYRSILKVEEGMLRQQSQMDLSIGEMHMIEAIAKEKEKGRTITDIAQDQSLSLPTVTVAINKLVKKGYVEKIRDEKDGRVVYVRCTRQGQRADTAHRFFHRQMLLDMTQDLSQAERDALLSGAKKLNRYFKAVEAQLSEKERRP